jgi:Dolichyl-phosphate-mannose-protein mannosyltransferase
MFSWRHVASWIEAKSGLLAATLCVCLALSSLAIAARRPFWVDEIITLSNARSPSLKDLLAKYPLSVDQTPPLNAIFTWLLGSIFGWTELVPRIPAAIFVSTGLFIVFRMVRRVTNGLSGLATMAILLVTSLPTWAYDGRPYGMLFFASTVALWFWTSEQDASSRQWSRRTSLFFGLAMMLTVFAHYFGVLVILPFVIEEVRSRGPLNFLSFRLFYGLVGLGVALIIQFPFIKAGLRIRQAFPGVASLDSLQTTYVEIMMPFILALVCIVLLFALASPSAGTFVDGQSQPEKLGWFFLGIPIAGYILANLVTHVFHSRYFISLLSGFGLGIGCFLYRHWRDSPQAPLLILAITIPLFLHTTSNNLRYARTPAVSKRIAQADFVDELLPQLRREGKLLVVVPTAKSYVEARYYATEPQAIRVLLSPPYPESLVENPMAIRYILRSELRQHARESALIDPAPELLSQLQGQGFRIRWRMTTPIVVVYPE